MRLIETANPPEISPLGLDETLSPEEEALRANLQSFAEERMEPICSVLDRLSPGEVIDEDSEWRRLFLEFVDLGIDIDAVYLGSDKISGNRLKSIAYEELGRGDSGFATGLMVAFFPYVMCKLVSRDDLAAEAQGKIGCWIATQQVRGSDAGDVDGAIIRRGGRHEAPDLYATFERNRIILNGRSSNWVSLGPVAEIALGYFPLLIDGAPAYNDAGVMEAIAVLVPLDRPGVSKGPPLDKLGQRALPQGAIAFDNVELPREFLVAEPDDYRASFAASLIEGNQTLGAIFTGLARRAFEHALAYAHERRQGGAIIADHQLVSYRLFDNFRKIQAMRAVMRQSFDYNGRAPSPQLFASVTSKTFVTETAIDVAADCIRIFGGNGLTRAFPMEKLLRDAQAAVTEDGDNHILALIAGSQLSNIYRQSGL